MTDLPGDSSVLSQKFATLDSRRCAKAIRSQRWSKSMARRRLEPVVLSEEERSELKALSPQDGAGACASDANKRLLAQSGRALLCSVDGQKDQTWHLPKRCRP